MPRKKRENKAPPPLKGMTIRKPIKKLNEPVEIMTSDLANEERKNRLKSWITFYRHNPSYFIEHYLGIALFPYQRYWINLIAHSTDFLGIASRASAKSWIIAVYTMAKCILYPGTKTVLASSTKAQAGLIISAHCLQLANDHPNVLREIKPNGIVTNANKWQVSFKNGSVITVVISGEGGRGNRSNVLVLEERRLIPTEIIDSILRPFAVSRKAPYMMLQKYANIKEEEAQEIIITSAYYKSHEWWIEAKKLMRKVADGDPDVKCIFLDYLISLKHGIKTRKAIQKDKDKFDPVTFLMEYGNIPYGSSSLSFFKLGLFNRTVKRSWRPITDEMWMTTKKNPYDIPKLSTEYRIVSVDVAMIGGSTNDNTIITCARLLPSKKGWLTEICYMESHNGGHTTIQATRIKQIYEEFNADTLVLDVRNSGINVFDALAMITKDETRGLEYPAYTVMDDPEEWINKDAWEVLNKRTIGENAKPCVFPISASLQLNSAIAISFKDRLKRRMLSFLIDDSAEEEFLIKSNNTDILDQDDTGIRAHLLQAHIQTTLFVNESIALDMMMIGGLVKVAEQSGARKDRYTSVSYLNYFVSLLDIQLLKYKTNNNDEDLLNLIQFA